MKWILPKAVDRRDVAMLASRPGVTPFLASILCGRGVHEIDDGFLLPRLATLSDPFLLPDMEAAVTRIFQAADRGEKITLYGDYDVDGATSVCLISKLLIAYGIDVSCFLPHRIEEGYGLTRDGLERCLTETNPKLIIAVDCGTNSAVEIAAIRAQGVDAIVLDHHECDVDIPTGCPVVNPKRGNDFHYLCSAGLAFKLCHALLKVRRVNGFDLKNGLDLVALGTVADLVPLVEENRILVNAGLKVLEKTRRPGLRALMEVAGASAPLNSRDVGFKLAPRLNASGRLGTAMESLALLASEDPVESALIARSLNTCNSERQRLERWTQEAAENQLAGSFEPERDSVIVVGGEGWHPGVLGIVSSRLMRKYHRPSIVVGFDGNGFGKGSARSIRGLSLVKAMAECSEFLDQFGGHQMAAGLSLYQKAFPDFARKFAEVATRILTKEELTPTIRLDAELHPTDINEQLLHEHELLEPFGMANEQPLFLAKQIAPDCEPLILKEKHLKIHFGSGRSRVTAIYFNGALNGLPKLPWDIAFHLERNSYRGASYPQMHIKAIRSSGQ